MKIIILIFSLITINGFAQDSALEECQNAFLVAWIKLDSVRSANKLLIEGNGYLKVVNEHLRLALAIRDSSLLLSEERIKTLEALPRTIITVEQWSWWKKLLVIMGAFGTGVGVGIIYSNNK